MARNFDGTGDVIICSIGGCNITSAAHTIAWVARRNTDGAYQTVVLGAQSTPADIWAVGWNPTNTLYYWNENTAVITGPAAVAADGWIIGSVGKAAGSATPRFHKYPMSTRVWAHSNGSGACPNPTFSQATIRIGNNTGASEAMNGDLAAIAVWDRLLTDAETETLDAGWMQWLGLAPIGAWILDQSDVSQSVVDATGLGANQTSITQTTVAASSVPLWGYGAPIVAMGRGSTPVVTQDVRPDGDVAINAWLDEGGATSSLWSSIDEAGAASDADYVTVTV